ncbi:MAG: phosphatidylglycerol lysyltransferase domain-containing protein [Oscillospiraceae bacterium]|nr:phosphatidylglycerol lysyltransferase domain-containing protein [Oscillospiraceae bacterium]
MLNFRKITIDDRFWIRELLKKSDYRGCEYSFANNLAWQRLSDTMITRFEDFYLSVTAHKTFTFPAGDGDYDKVLAEMLRYSGEKLVISNVTSEMMLIIDKFIKKNNLKKEVDIDNDWWDYIYFQSDLATFKGKKYEKKRNHLNRFYQYNWEYKPLEKEYFNECIAFAALSYNLKDGFTERSSVVEQYAIDRFFEYFEEMELMGGTLWVDDLLVAFTIGEKLNSDTFCTHIEKADINYHGAFTAINNEFAKRIDCKYINREEDMGIMGLRKSKISYKPCFQLEKNTVTIFS